MLHKNLTIEAVNLKFAEDGRKFSGYASVFGGVDTYGDTIMPGAYAKTIASRQRPIQLRWNHHGDVIGKWVEIKEDETGLYVEGELTPGHSKADDVYALMKHGAVNGMSIGYRVVEGTKNDNGGLDLHEIELVEISVVESPADINAQVADVKSAIDEAESLKQVESLLRDAGGFSRAESVALVARIKALVQSDSDARNQPAEIAGVFDQFSW